MKICFLIAVLTAVAAQAGLEWEQKEVTLQVQPTQVAADAVFRFSNTGEEPVHLNDVKVTCGCLSSKVTKRIYVPGESGEVVIRFDLLNRIGKQRKTAIALTGNNEETSLFIDVDIPESFTIESKLIQWKKGDIEERKTTRLINSNTNPIGLLSLTSSNKELPAELKTIREGFEYEVVVAHKGTNTNVRSVIRIATAPPPGQTESKPLKLYVHAH